MISYNYIEAVSQNNNIEAVFLRIVSIEKNIFLFAVHFQRSIQH